MSSEAPFEVNATVRLPVLKFVLSVSVIVAVLLILVGANNRPAITSILFPTEAACAFAKEKVTAGDAFGSRVYGHAVCVPRNAP